MARSGVGVTKPGTDRLDGWLPIRFDPERPGASVEWCYVGSRRLVEPFFDQTIEECLRDPFNLLFRHRTPVEALAECHAARPGLAPSGFVLHASRSGSTLVAQMLAVLPDTVVVSEAQPVDAVLRRERWEARLDDARRVDVLRWLMSALGQPRSGAERSFVVKLDSWSVLDLGLIERAFPDVPWVFLYRDPAEILASQLRRRSAHMVPGVVDPTRFGLDGDAATTLAPEEYCARVLARVYEAALERAVSGSALLVQYRELPDAVFSRLMPAFGITCDDAGHAAMRRRASLDAKNPYVAFGAGASPPTEAQRAAADAFVRPHYERLEALRVSRPAAPAA